MQLPPTVLHLSSVPFRCLPEDLSQLSVAAFLVLRYFFGTRKTDTPCGPSIVSSRTNHPVFFFFWKSGPHRFPPFFSLFFSPLPSSSLQTHLNMAATLIPRNFRPADKEEAEPGWLKRQVTSVLQTISRRACLHPIHTIVVVALLASTTYVGLIEGSIFDTIRNPRNVAGQVDVDTLLQGSRNLRLGESTSWKWQIDDALTHNEAEVSLPLIDRMMIPGPVNVTHAILTVSLFFFLVAGCPASGIGHLHFPRLPLAIRVHGPCGG